MYCINCTIQIINLAKLHYEYHFHVCLGLKFSLNTAQDSTIRATGMRNLLVNCIWDVSYFCSCWSNCVIAGKNSKHTSIEQDIQWHLWEPKSTKLSPDSSRYVHKSRLSSTLTSWKLRGVNISHSCPSCLVFVDTTHHLLWQVRVVMWLCLYS